jgi:hypothetical protein
MQLLAWFKPHRFAWSDTDLGACSGIAANTGFAGADAEYAKSAQFDALSGGEGLLQALEDRIHRGFCLDAWQARALDYMMDDVLLNQWGNLTGKFDCTTTCGNDATDFNAIMEQQEAPESAFAPGKPMKYLLLGRCQTSAANLSN